jgi:transposase InsO family protein
MRRSRIVRRASCSRRWLTREDLRDASGSAAAVVPARPGVGIRVLEHRVQRDVEHLRDLERHLQGRGVTPRSIARPPLLFISGKDDHLFPPKVGHSNVKHYKSKTVTEIVEFDGPHFLPATPGWETVADFALDWALKHATGAPAS